MDTSKSEIAAVSAVDQKSGRRQHGQFNHVQTYARQVSKLSGKAKKDKSGNVVEKKQPRQWSISDIAGEADRDEAHSQHVLKKLKPVLVKGVPISEIERLCDEMMLDAKQASGTRAVRSDTHTLVAAVYSLPYRPDDYAEHREICDQFIGDAMLFHEKAYGKIVSAVMHLDESMIHWHVYTLDPDARNCVPGWKAKRQEMKRQEADGASKKEAIRQGNIAYKQAMKKLQDIFFNEVGEKNGLGRYGDRRMRYQPGEARQKRIEREEHARMLRDREIQQEANRKKIAADIAEQERINAEAAENLAELIKEKKQIESNAELVNKAMLRVGETVVKLTSKPEFVREQEIKREHKELEAANRKIADLEEKLIEKNSFIDSLLLTIRDLKRELKTMKEKLKSFFR